MSLSSFRIVAVLAATLALFGAVSASLPSDAVELPAALFDKYTQSNKHLLVEFFAPWCGHCQAFAPDFERIATQLKPKLVVAKVDCTRDSVICQRFSFVEGYPTLAFFEGDTPQKYYGDRSVEDVVKWVEGKIDEAASATASIAKVLHNGNFNATLKSNPAALIEFYAPWCGHCKALAPIYDEVAQRLGAKHLVGKVNCDLNPTLCARFNIEGYPTVMFFKNGKPATFNGDRTVDALVQFVEDSVGSGPNGNVLELTAESFDGAIQLHEAGILVEFFAPWCGHCKALAPEYEKAAGALKPSGVPLAKVDCVAEHELCQRFEVGGYPTLKWFQKQVAVEYGGGRQSADIVAWVRRKTYGPVQLLESAAQIDEWIASHAEGVVGLFSSKDKFYEILLHVADAREELQFAAVVDRTLAEAHTNATPAVKYLRPDSIGEDLLFDSRDYAQLSNWLTQNSLPLVGEVGPETFKRYMALGIPLMVAFVEPDRIAELYEMLTPVAKEFAGAFSFGYSDGLRWKDVAKRWYGEYSALPVLVNVNFKNDYQLPYKGEFTTDAVRQFAADVQTGRVKWTPRSEPEPAEQTGSVQVVVGSTLEAVINQPKDVLIEFYAPWCGHCRYLEPIYEELATELKPVPSVVLAKFDHTANDVKHTVVGNSVQGYPTVMLFPVHRKTTPVVFAGDRTVKGLAEFLLKNVDVKFEPPKSLKQKLSGEATEAADAAADAAAAEDNSHAGTEPVKDEKKHDHDHHKHDHSHDDEL